MKKTLIILPNFEAKINKFYDPFLQDYEEVFFADCFYPEIYDAITSINPHIPVKLQGDLDSFTDFANVPKQVSIVKNTCQETTDLEKILKQTNSQNIHIFSDTLGRADHFLYNLNLLRQFYTKNITIITPLEMIFLQQNHLKISHAKNHTLSFFALFEDVNVEKTTGLAYNVADTRFCFGKFSSQSNQISHESAELFFAGLLLFVLEHRQKLFVFEENHLKLC